MVNNRCKDYYYNYKDKQNFKFWEIRLFIILILEIQKLLVFLKVLKMNLFWIYKKPIFLLKPMTDFTC